LVSNKLRPHSFTDLLLVNELSGTIDLNSTLIRAEALFRRFKRVVEAIDRKHHFPAPSSARQRKSVAGAPENADSTSSTTTTSEAQPANASSSGVANGKQPAGATETTGTQEEKERIITPLLRKLLSRKVEKMERKEIEKHGGGVGS
jgi:TBC1 domain family member 15